MFKIEQLIPQAVCLKCNICCRFKERNTIWAPKLLEYERKISGLRDKDFYPVPNPEWNNFICPFFDTKENKCKIYTTRPFECQLYPFLLNSSGENIFLSKRKIRKKVKIFLAADLTCSFIRNNFDNQKFRRYCSYLTDFLNRPVVSRILKNNTNIIHSYDGVFNLAELNP